MLHWALGLNIRMRFFLIITVSKLQKYFTGLELDLTVVLYFLLT